MTKKGRHHDRRKAANRSRKARAFGTPRTPGASSEAATPAGAGSAAGAAGTAAGRRALIRPWWERVPGRLEYELAALDHAGITHGRDEAAFTEGRLALELQATLPNGTVVQLAARFPPMYPYERFEVYAPDLELAYHQNPFDKNLCLIGQGTEHWRTDDTLAQFICDRLPRVLEVARAQGTAAVAGLEERQAEPFSAYYPYAPGAMLLVDGTWDLDPQVTSGTLRIGLTDSAAARPLRGAVLEVRDTRNEVIARADPALADVYPVTLMARWLRVPGPIKQAEAAAFYAEAAEFDARLRQPMTVSVGSSRIDVLGVVFPEEHTWRGGGEADGWVFVVRTFKPVQENAFVRAGRAGRQDLAERVPELASLRQHRVAIFGLGGLGGPSAIELARAGLGELRILDGDFSDPATACRWPLGFAAAGLEKAPALAAFLRSHYPYTRVVAYPLRLGDPNVGPRELDVLAAMLDDADLVYDATAELGLQHLLSDLAREQGTPYVCLWTTPGAWGGLVARVRPQRMSGCWSCLQGKLTTGDIPRPPADPKGSVQPAGCSSPTFTGSGFDLAEVALSGVRLAIGTLGRDAPGAYPDSSWDVGVVALRDPSGCVVPPTWRTYVLHRHPGCENCRP